MSTLTQRLEAGCILRQDGQVDEAATNELMRQAAEEIKELAETLEGERRAYEALARDCEEMVNRLDRLHVHLRTGVVPQIIGKLADYAGGFIDFEAGIGYDEVDNPPPDPFPDPPPPPKRCTQRRKQKEAGND